MRRFLSASVVLLSTLCAGEALALEPLDGTFVVGVDLGELPWQGSFKPGITFGYHLNDLVYVGGLFQIGDSIERDGTSINANAIGLDGLTDSRESVAPRALLHARLRPHRLSPFISLGMVYNGTDTEVTQFDSRSRQIGSGTYDGTITVTQERPAAVRPAIGFGYSYTFDMGLELSTEWTGAIYERAPEPRVGIRSDTPLSAADEADLRGRIVDEFPPTVPDQSADGAAPSNRRLARAAVSQHEPPVRLGTTSLAPGAGVAVAEWRWRSGGGEVAATGWR